MHRRRALIISNKVFFPATDGGSIAMQDLAKILISQKYKLDIVAISKKKKLTKTKNWPIESTINDDKQDLEYDG